MIALLIIAIITIAIYYFGTRTFNYWEKKGIKCDKPIPIFGNNLRYYTLKASITQIANELYWKYPNEKVVGFYRATKPELLIRDPEIIKSVMCTDFMSFHHRGFTPENTVFEPLMQNLFAADGDIWKLLRKRLSPAFTSGKLKAMFPLIVERAERLQARALATAANGKSIDARHLMARYTTDFIGACAFGLDADTLQQEDNAFIRLGKKVFGLRPVDIFKAILKEAFPDTFKNVKTWNRLEPDFYSLLGEIFKARNYKPSGRNDFIIDIMLEYKQQGAIVGDSMTNMKPDGTPEEVRLEFNDGVIAAQVFIFFAAGFETSSSATSFTLHQLAFNQDVQKKVQDEIDRVLAKHNGKLSYDSIQEMKYLEWTFKEGMRIFPSLGFLIRRSTKPHTFPELNLTIDAGVKILIPVHALHNDPKYFKNPEEFRPERFSPEEFDAKLNYVYLPFGVGPRACVGERLGLMQSLAGLAAVLSAFTVLPAPESVLHPVVDPKSIVVQGIKGGLPLLFQERKTKSV